MQLAIEKLSPIPGRAIFFTNLWVAFKTLALPSGLWLIFTGEWFSWELILGFVLWVLGLTNILGAWRQNIALRKLKYSGVIGFFKSDDENPRWISTLAPRTKKNPMKTLSLAVLVAKLLDKQTDDADSYAQVAFGRDESNALIAKLVHHCDGNCSKPEIHLFGYEEDRDGLIHWS